MPETPESRDRLPMSWVEPPHPATLPVDQLLKTCQLRTQPRSGPGGQHRNRTSSGAFLQHLPSGIVGEATERRSQAQNREIVVQRLRFRLAILLRTRSVLDQDDSLGELDPLEAAVRAQYRGHALRINDQNEAKPAVLAILLNDLHACGGRPSLVAQAWSVNTSRIVALLKSYPAAWALVNQIRQHHGRSPLK